MIDDILQYICNYADQFTRIKITEMTKHTEATLYVYKLHSEYIKQKTLHHHKFSKLRSLNINDNKNINNLDHLAETLVELYCARSCINQKTITKLKFLRILHGNAYINDVSHMCGYIEDISNCNINQEQLNKLHKISKLSISYNPYVVDLSHLKDTLTELECCGYGSGINQDAIDKLENLCVLKCDNNTKIKNVNKWKNSLKILHCKSSGILQKGLSDLKVLETLLTDYTISRQGTTYMYDSCYDITHVSASIREIECKYIDQDALNKMSKLEKLTANPYYIKKLDHLKETLVYLDFGCYHIDRKIIDGLNNLKFVKCIRK